MRSLSLKLALIALALVVAGCGEPGPAATASTTSSAAATTTSTTPTTTTSKAPTTTTASTTTTSTSTTPVPIEGPEPEITLKPPGYFDGLLPDQGGEYFIFKNDISTSHTTRFSTAFDGEGWSMTARVDGELAHSIATEEMAGEMLMSGAKSWMRDENGTWVADDENVEPPPFIFFATPDVAYGTAFSAFEAMEFDGWIDTGEETLAVYRGGREAVALTYGPDPLEGSDGLVDGAIEAWWSPVGYFAMVRIIEDDGYGSTFETNWTVTDVGTTQVEPPPA